MSMEIGIAPHEAVVLLLMAGGIFAILRRFVWKRSSKND